MTGNTIWKLLGLLTACLFAVTALAEDGAAAKVTMANGMVTVASGDGTIRELARDDTVRAGDVVSTSANSYVSLLFTDGGRVLLRPNSRFVIDEYSFEATSDPAAEEPEGSGQASMRLLRGGFRAVTGAIARDNRDNVEVRTPVATLGIRGTDFEARMCAGDCFDVHPRPADGLYTGVHSGAISVTNPAGEVVTAPGQFSFTAGPATIPTTIPFRPRALGQDPMPDPTTCD